MIRNQQIDNLSELFLDIAKGILLGTLATPFFTTSDIIVFVKGFGVGAFCTFLSIKVLEFKKE